MIFFFLPEILGMKRIGFSISVTTLGLVLFIILSSFHLPFIYLQLCFVSLTFSLLWMVITILKSGKPAVHTFNERFYEDGVLGPAQNHHKE